MKTTIIIVQALIISRLDYCNFLLCGLPAILIKRLQREQNAAARVIAKAGGRDYISQILFKLHWLPVEFRIKYKILLLSYRALHGLAPTYITELLVPYTPPRTLRSSTEHAFSSPEVYTDLKTLKLRLQHHGTVWRARSVCRKPWPLLEGR